MSDKVYSLGEIKAIAQPIAQRYGMTAQTAQQQLAFSDGAIVGSYFREYGEAEYPVDEKRVKDSFATPEMTMVYDNDTAVRGTHP